MSKRIGLLGGSFNPAHEGHLHISLEAMKRLKLDAVWWLVSPQNPLKSTDGMAAYEDRFASAEAMARHPRIHVSDIEQTLGTRYTVDTLRQLIKRAPRNQFVWLMGADNLAQLHRWKEWDQLLQLSPLAVLDRAPYALRALHQPFAKRFTKQRCAATHASKLLFCAQKPHRWAYITMKRHPSDMFLIPVKSLRL